MQGSHTKNRNKKGRGKQHPEKLLTEEKLSVVPSLNHRTEDKPSDLIHLLQSDAGQHAHYVLNTAVIRSDYESRYMNVAGGEYKFILPLESLKYFPDTQLFNLESLDWETIKLSPFTLIRGINSARKHMDLGAELESAFMDHRYICTFGRVKLLSKSSKISNPKKIILEHIHNSYEDMRTYIMRNTIFVRDCLEDFSVLDAGQLGFDRESHFCLHISDDTKCRPKVALSELHQQWLLDVDKYIMDVYNQTIDLPADNRFLRLKVDTLCKINGILLATLMLRRLIGFCKKICNCLYVLIKLVSYYQEIGNDYAFTTVPDKSIAAEYGHIVEEQENSDEEQCNHTTQRRLIFRPFEEAQETYSRYAIQLIKSYEEIKKRSAELDYLYNTVFRFDYYGKFDIPCDVVHLGFFYEIVLSDPSVMEAIKISYEGLCAYGGRIGKVQDVTDKIRLIVRDKEKFARKWRQRKDLITRLLEMEEKELYADLQADDRFVLDDPWEMEKFDDFYQQSSDSFAGFVPDFKEDAYNGTNHVPAQPKEEKKGGKNRKRRKRKKRQKAENAKIDNKPRLEVDAARPDLICNLIKERVKSDEIDKTLMTKEKMEQWEEEDEELEMDLLLFKYRNTTGAPRLKPNIPQETIKKMKENLRQRLKESLTMQ